MQPPERTPGQASGTTDAAREAAILYEALQSAPRPHGGVSMSHWPSMQPVRVASADVRMEVLRLACLDAAAAGRTARHWRAEEVVYVVAHTALVGPPEQVAALLDATDGTSTEDPSWFSHVEYVVDLVRKPLTPGVVAALERARDRFNRPEHGWTARVIKKIDRLLWNSTRVLRAEGPWSRRVLDDIAGLDASGRDAWCELTRHLIAAGDSVPAKKWSTALPALLNAIGRDEAESRVLAWLALGPTPGAIASAPMREQDQHYLKGFVWALSGATGTAVPGVLADLAERCLRKIPNRGPVAASAGYACVRVLSRLPGLEPVAQLTRLRERIKYVVARQLITKALAEVAAGAGLTSAALEEVAVPTFGLEPAGSLRREVGAFTAELRVAGSDVSLSWLTGDGRRRTSVPAAVRAEHADTLAELKASVKAIASVMPAQQARLERLLTEDRSWGLTAWRERYVDHPVVGQMARRLIWQFANDDRASLGGLVDGCVVDVDDRPLGWLGPAATVRPWHPLGAPADQVDGWRTWLERHQITQPFKQAHREIYVLTDAERATGTFSNRFAGHVLRQHQLAALCRARGWRYQIQGGWDGHNTPTLRLPAHDVDVEFWIETPDDPDARGRTGGYTYVSTDQVRFRRASAAVRLDTVPPLVFSEVMRDVDLFVGVCSLGTDPVWADRPAGPFNAYWQSFAFGELGTAATTRREILAALIPRLRGSDRLSLETSSLVVRGRLWTYKIHLGSGNVRMEPGSRYLCIVPDRANVEGGRVDVWLPFEGDHMLAVIISKALLLLNDAEITDPVIVQQIR